MSSKYKNNSVAQQYLTMNVNDNNTINTKTMEVVGTKKKFIPIAFEGKQLKMKLTNIFLPFGPEPYNGKTILNIEFGKNNEHNNNLSVLDALETRAQNKEFKCEPQVKNMLQDKQFTKSIKMGKNDGMLLRTHLLKSAEVYIKKKDGGKMEIDPINLKKTTCDIEVALGGIWENGDNYGLYFTASDVCIKEFNGE